MKRFFGITLTVFLAIGMIMPMMAQGEATVLFLMINPGARQGGMGEAGVALADDANAVYWNPAGLAYQYEDPDTDLSFHLGVAKTLYAHQLMLIVDFIGEAAFSDYL